MVTLYKPWIKNIDEVLDNTMCNPKDLLSRHLRWYLLYKNFLKAIMMKVLRAKIALDFHRTKKTNIGLDNGYSPTLNRKHEVMTGVEKIYCEPTNIFVVNDHMDLGEEYF